MPWRLVAGAAGVVVIGAAALAFLLPSHAVVAGTNRVELVHGALIIQPQDRHKCQAIPSVPGDADRLVLGIAGTFGGKVEHLDVEVDVKGVKVSGGTVGGVEPGTVTVARLDPPTPAATRRARVCFINRGTGYVALLGELRKVLNRNGEFVRRPVAGVLFLAPGEASWFSRLGEIARRYGYSQAGVLGPWTLSMVVLFGLAAVLFAVSAILDVDLAAWRREWREVTTTEWEELRQVNRDKEREERDEQRSRQERELRRGRELRDEWQRGDQDR